MPRQKAHQTNLFRSELAQRKRKAEHTRDMSRAYALAHLILTETDPFKAMDRFYELARIKEKWGQCYLPWGKN